MSGGYCSTWIKCFLFMSLCFLSILISVKLQSLCFFQKANLRIRFPNTALGIIIAAVSRFELPAGPLMLKVWALVMLCNMLRIKPPTKCQDPVRSGKVFDWSIWWGVKIVVSFPRRDTQWWGSPDEEGLSASGGWGSGRWAGNRSRADNVRWSGFLSVEVHTLAHTQT